jgi:hypothetical protein
LANYRRYKRKFGSEISIQEFYRLYQERLKEDTKLKTPKAMDDAFAEFEAADEWKIKALIDAYNAANGTRLDQEIFV